MSAHNVVGATESFINGMAASMVLGGRRPVQMDDDPRTIHAVRQLIHQLERERAARAALQEENELLRNQLIDAAAIITRMRDLLA